MADIHNRCGVSRCRKRCFRCTGELCERSEVLTRTFAFIAACTTAAALQTVNAPSAVAAPAYQEYVALGDSWSADVTLVDIDASQTTFACAQNRRSYPKQVAAALGVSTFRDATCGSAKTTDMTAAQPVPEPSAPIAWNTPQFDRLTPTTDLVTLGIGGNDAGLDVAAKGCVGNPNCKAQWIAGGVDKMSVAIDATEAKVVGVLNGIRARSPRARVLVVDYLAGMAPISACGAANFMTDSDLGWIGEKLIELNDMLRRAAAASGAEVVDTHSSSVGHDACQAPGVRWVEGASPLAPQGVAIPFHPNQLGADHQAVKVKQALGI